MKRGWGLRLNLLGCDLIFLERWKKSGGRDNIQERACKNVSKDRVQYLHETSKLGIADKNLRLRELTARE